MGVTTTNNKPLNPRGNDQSPLAFNRAKLYSGKALDFDGVNDYVQCDNLDTLYSSDFTISYFFKWESTGDNWGTTQGSAGTNLALLTGKDGSGVIRFAFWGNDLDAPASLTPAQNEWSFLSFTYNRTTKERKIYINGILAAEDVSASNPNPTANNFQIGAFTAIGGYYNNQVSNVKVFNTALTAAQVADLYNNPEKVVPTGVDNTALKLWLPMQEGAGTTAYDGSGNGNHGTISGATYTHGIGAPVSQTAVIDWNKGTNETAYSEEFNSWATKDFGVVIVDNDATAPDGQETAATITFAANQVSSRVQDFKAGSFGSTKQIVSVWARVTSGTAPFRFKCSHGGVTDYFSNDLTATTEWQRFSFSQTFGSSAGTGVFYGLYNGTDLAARSLEFWGFQLQTDAAALTPYIPTLATAQTSEVLLPQGLTTGRDITGVNLFENVRKQGALNLDGNSWAEVHDNASLDMTTTATMEVWINADELDNTSQHIFVKSSQSFWTGNYGRYVLRAGENNVNWWFDDFTSNSKVYTISLSGWNHLAVTKDGTAEKLYINGALVDTETGAATFTASTFPLLIGSRTAYGEFFKNQIAQPRIYNRALTAAEVQKNYNAGKNTYTN